MRAQASLPSTQFEWLGGQEYLVMDNRQKSLIPELAREKRELVFGLEFSTVMTAGNRLKLRREDFEKNNLPFVATDRGGLVTIHSPGQLVIFPMINLRERGWGPKQAVDNLLRVTQETLRSLNIDCEVSQGEGVYTANGKIAFCGLKVDRGILRHGLSINVHNDLKLFSQISACGVKNAKLDLVANYLSITTEELFCKWSGFWKENH